MRYQREEKIEVKLLSMKLIAHVSPEFAKAYHMPEDHQSAGFFCTDNDDVAYLAADDATKKANVKVLHAKTFYGGEGSSWSKNGGSIMVLLSGPKVADVKSGLQYAKDYIERRSGLYCFDGDPETSYYVDVVPRVGKYFSEWCNIEEGTSYTYLVGPPTESAYALDKALKAGDTRIVRYWAPPSNANSCGAVLAGTESACRSAKAAFVDAVRFALNNPDQI